MDWRTIEFHIIDILRRDGVKVDEDTRSGDKFAIEFKDDVYNITEFARSLATRLSMKVSR